MTLPRLAPVMVGLAILAGFTLDAIPQDKTTSALAKTRDASADDEPLLFNQTQVIQTNGLRGWACCLSPDGKTLASCAGNAEQAGENHVWGFKEEKNRHTS